MKIADFGLVLGYAVTSTLAILLVKMFANDAMQAWKSAPGISSPLVFVGMGSCLYAFSFLVWMVILARNELSVVYPMMIGLTLATTTLVAWFVLKESIDLLRLSGILVIFVGIILITKSRSS